MEDLKKELLEEIPALKKAGEQFLSGEMSKMDFKRYSGGYGIYAERDKKHFMIRLRILSGVFSKEQLRFVCEMGHKFNIGHIHITTRQAIQFHELDWPMPCEIIEEGLKHNIYTRGAGGNFPRNVAMSPLSGFDVEDFFDVTPYAMATNAYFLERITTYKLPRKLKVSFSSNVRDTSHATVQDLGFVAAKDGEKDVFEIYIGGGMGRDPITGVKVDLLLPAEDVLFAVEAMVHLFTEHGDYENHSKARVRYILQRMGEEAFIACFKEYLQKAYESADLKLHVETPVYKKQGKPLTKEIRGVIPQKQEGLYSYYFHPIGGRFELSLLEEMLSLITPMEDVHIRYAMSEGIYIVLLNGEEAEKIAEALAPYNTFTYLERSTSCIGVPICQMGVLNSQGTLRSIIDYFRAKGEVENILPSLHISGCQNSCGVHQIGKIGLMGKMKRVEGQMCNAFELQLGGTCQLGETVLGASYGDLLQEQVPAFLYQLAELVKESGMDYMTFIQERPESLQALLTQYIVK